MVNYKDFAFQGEITKSKLKGSKKTVENKLRFLKNLCKNGYISSACRVSQVSRKLVYVWRKDDEYFESLWYEIEEARKDWAEAQLFQNMGEGKETSTIFYLKTKAKDRGYSERLEVTGADGGSIAVDSKFIKEASTDELLNILDEN